MKAPWYTSRTIWLGILGAVAQIVNVLPIPYLTVINTVLGSVASILAADKARDVLGPKQ